MSLKNNIKLLNGLKNKKLILILVLIILILVLIIFWKNKTLKSSDSELEDQKNNLMIEYKDLIKIDVSQFSQKISSPLLIQGQARGVWFFEASFPIYLQSLNGELLGQGLATAMQDWMTEDFVYFTAEINFDKKNLDQALLIFKKDNPSGLLEFEDQFIIPVDL